MEKTASTNDRSRPIRLMLALASSLSLASFAVPANAQPAPPPANGQPAPPPDDGQGGPPPDAQGAPPPYAAPGNAAYGYDAARHILHGTVASFSPYRLLLARVDGQTTEVDLKNGTIINPVGTTITPGMRVNVRGYWSKGVFIANRVTLR
jgi:hypothetical protein